METTDRYVELLRDGNQRALDHFIQEHVRPLTFFAAKLVRSEGVAEEIVGDSFLKLWEARGRFENPGHIHSFLYRVTRNACLNHQASPKGREHRYAELDENLSSPDADIFTKIVHAEFIQQLHAEVEKLPGQQATIFRMSYLEGYTTEEICAALDTTTSNVFYAKSKALATLKAVFKDRNPLVFVALSYFVEKNSFFH